MVAEARRRLELPVQSLTTERDALRSHLAQVVWPFAEAAMVSPYVDPASLSLEAQMRQGLDETIVSSRL